MPKNKKVQDSTDSDTSFEDRTPAKQPKKAEKRSDSGSQEENSFDLDKNRKVSVSEFKGKVFVGIREYYEKDGKSLPSKKGISLTVPQWKKLLEHADDINEAIKKI